MCLIKTHLISSLGFKMSAIKLTEEYADISKAQAKFGNYIEINQTFKERSVLYCYIYEHLILY